MSEETRTVSATGGEKGVKAERYDLLPKEGLDATARVYAFGATKYLDHNWRRGYEWSKSIAAAMRHLMAFADGETNDPESGEPHPAHAAFHMFALLTWLAEQGEGADNPMDDRWPALMERTQRETQEDLDEDLTGTWRDPEITELVVRQGPESLTIAGELLDLMRAETPPGWGWVLQETPPGWNWVLQADMDQA